MSKRACLGFALPAGRHKGRTRGLEVSHCETRGGEKGSGFYGSLHLHGEAGWMRATATVLKAAQLLLLTADKRQNESFLTPRAF